MRGVNRAVSRMLLVMSIFILLGSISVAAEKLFLDAHQGIVINGKNITFIGIDEEGVNVQVDAAYGFIATKNETQKIGGVFVTLLGLSKNPPIAILDVIVPFSCGDGSCNGGAGEDYASCCVDCGCLGGKKTCINNACLSNITNPSVLYDCLQDTDCSPSLQKCTTTSCDKKIIPFQCVTKDLEECIPADGCCPKECTINNDNDCLFVDQCTSDQECKDDDPCTTNACAGVPKTCQTTITAGCPKNDQCISPGTIEWFAYCGESGKFYSLKENGESCAEDYECITQQCNEVCKKGLLERIFPYTTAGIFFICIGLLGFYLYVLIRKRMEQG